jgi:dinuclear metal center YbgI/SA1388 family protein
MLKRNELTKYLNQLLNIYDYQDYGPNGLQIEGVDEIKKICFAVSATRDSIQEAVRMKADALIVHHGLFWKFHGVRTITKTFGKRVIPLIKNDINLYGYHLPLDAHIEVGNAAAVANKMELTDLRPFGDHKGMPTGVKGKFKSPLKASELQEKLKKILNHDVILASDDETKEISNIGIITGGANGDWIQAQKEGLDAYLTGEISEHDWHEAREGGVAFFAGGHNATEQFGVQELMKNLYDKYNEQGVEFFFIPSSNPA